MPFFVGSLHNMQPPTRLWGIYCFINDRGPSPIHQADLHCQRCCSIWYANSQQPSPMVSTGPQRSSPPAGQISRLLPAHPNPRNILDSTPQWRITPPPPLQQSDIRFHTHHPCSLSRTSPPNFATVGQCFRCTVDEYGWPSHVRRDFGTENNEIEKLMIARWGELHNTYLRGR